MGWGPRLSKKEKGKLRTSINLSLLPVCGCHITNRLTLLIQCVQLLRLLIKCVQLPYAPDTL